MIDMATVTVTQVIKTGNGPDPMAWWVPPGTRPTPPALPRAGEERASRRIPDTRCFTSSGNWPSLGAGGLIGQSRSIILARWSGRKGKQRPASAVLAASPWSKTMHRLLVVGMGSIGERHVRCLLATGRADVGGCEVRETLRNDIAQRYALGAVFASLDEALTEQWDAAVVATPAHTHISIASCLAAADVPLFVEKPLSVDLAGLSELLTCVREKRLIAKVG